MSVTDGKARKTLLIMIGIVMLISCLMFLAMILFMASPSSSMPSDRNQVLTAIYGALVSLAVSTICFWTVSQSNREGK